MRADASPSTAVAIWRMVRQTDARDVLPTIHVPTLILHRAGDLVVGVTHGRYLARHIPGAKYVELPGRDHVIYIGDTSSIIGEIEEFLTGERHEAEPDRVLATVLFTDVVGSTAYVVKFGDRAWGGSCSVVFTPLFVASSRDSGGARWIRPATASSAFSMGPDGRFDVRGAFAMPYAPWGSMSGSGCTPVSVN
jgi:hypothetical protein